MGRPWWYDSYWEKDKKSTRGRSRLPGRRSWVWIALVVVSLLLALESTGFRSGGIAWFLSFVSYACLILSFAVFTRVIVSWFMISRYNLLLILLDDITEPLLSRVRRIVPRFGVFDLTPLIAIALLYFIPLVLNRLLT